MTSATILELDDGKGFSIELASSKGPVVSALDARTEKPVSVQFDWEGSKLAAVVHESDIGDSDARTDEPAVTVRYDDNGRVLEVAVRKDLEDKVVFEK